MWRRDAGVALLLAALCVLAYAPSLGIPLISDDYPNIAQAQTYGSPAGAADLFRDAIFRLRATSYWTMYVLWQAFHLRPAAYRVFSLLLHLVNTWLVYKLSPAGSARWAAAFFAVHEGHQEAVMWFSAINELLMFFFGMAAVWCWKRGRWIAGIPLFALALLSKESAVIFVPLLLLVRPAGQKLRWSALLPYLLLTLAAVASVVQSHAVSFRFTDGSFSLSAPFYLTWPRSFARLLWIWGWIALAVILLRRDLRKPAIFSLTWIGIALIPYSFLTYSTAIPSRQVYLASAGLAWLIGLAATRLEGHPRLAAAVLAIMLCHNMGYLWIRKRAQFLERARPTEQLIALARATPGPIRMRCWPLNELHAREAVRLGAGRDPSILIWSEAEAAQSRPTATFCFTP